MDNVNELGENKLQAAAESAEAGKEINTAPELGKFKSVDALLSAYLSLEAEFTRRSQRLKELEEGNKSAPEQGAPSRKSIPEGEELLRAALSDGNVRNAVLEDYLKSVSQGAVPLILGGVAPSAPKDAPKTVKEAGNLARRFLKEGKRF